jgi:cephalosporin hydroxylase
MPKNPRLVEQSEVEDLVRRFNALYCQRQRRTWKNTHWFGVPALKCPLDLWVYQEILHRTRPDVIVETGTSGGGSAYFMATICDLIDAGRIVTVDIADKPGRPDHPRVTYLKGSATDPRVVEEVRSSIGPEDRVMVLLDSNHKQDFVEQELEAYAPLVTSGCYLIVEDTNLNYWMDFGPGPLEAVEAFLASDAGRPFSVDSDCEKFFMTFNPSGYLLRE